jgi:hypothetical protein
LISLGIGETGARRCMPRVYFAGARGPERIATKTRKQLIPKEIRARMARGTADA